MSVDCKLTGKQNQRNFVFLRIFKKYTHTSFCTMTEMKMKGEKKKKSHY